MPPILRRERRFACNKVRYFTSRVVRMRRGLAHYFVLSGSEQAERYPIYRGHSRLQIVLA